jgi:hypothetical protein
VTLEYPRRTNLDGTIDSICPLCYLTVGTASSKADLERVEAEHVCEPSRLAYFEEGRSQVENEGDQRKPPRSEPIETAESVSESASSGE